MAMSEINNAPALRLAGEVLEKVILHQDLSPLKPEEKVEYLKNLSLSLGLNPLTKPFEIMKFQGKEIPYARKDCTEQLRKIHNVSVRSLETKTVMDNVYVVTAYAILPNGREDSSTGAVSISGLKGDALANAMMKAETKAKRRVTLSICGLGMLDETEMETMPGATTYSHVEVKEVKNVISIESESRTIEKDLADISWAENMESLQSLYKKSYKYWASQKNQENLNKVMQAKDQRKLELEKELYIGEEEIDSETGEIS